MSTDARPTTLTEWMTARIAEALTTHGEVWGDTGMHGWECKCGWPGDDTRHPESDYRAHVATVLALNAPAAYADHPDCREGWRP